MADNNIDTDKKQAPIYHHTDDLGGGMGFCGNCDQSLGGDPFSPPKECPKCGCELYMTTVGLTAYPFGGSDF